MIKGNNYPFRIDIQFSLLSNKCDESEKKKILKFKYLLCIYVIHSNKFPKIPNLTTKLLVSSKWYRGILYKKDSTDIYNIFKRESEM